MKDSHFLARQSENVKQMERGVVCTPFAKVLDM